LGGDQKIEELLEKNEGKGRTEHNVCTGQPPYTPQYTCGVVTTEKTGLQGNVCFENGECYGRDDVNYIAQGMWSAAALEGKVGGEFIANYWKNDQYGHEAGPDVLYWIDVGVDTYREYDNQYHWP